MKLYQNFVSKLNNTLNNLGNATTDVNYGAWGSTVSVAPLSGFKASTYEGGTRSPFIIKPPTSSAAKTHSPITSLLFVTDITPTILDYAKASPPGTTYKGHEVHPIMGKSIKPLLDGTVDTVHGANEPIGTEMFNNTGVYKGDWLAMYDQSHPKYNNGTWQLYNILNDPAQNNNLADKHPDILQQMMADYQKYSKDVGIVIPTGKTI
jgi:arylsulfatase A-like enzyme